MPLEIYFIFLKFKYKNKLLSSKKILISPLSWGLGHVTRCLPIAQYLLSQKYEVSWAFSNIEEKKIIQKYFPEAKMLLAPHINIKYAKNKKFFLGKIFLQSPQFLQLIRKEKQWLKTIQKKEKFDIIISDNRYGMRHPDCINIFISHQIYPISGKGERMDAIVAKMQKQFLKKFDAVWKLDDEKMKISGKLAWRRKDEYPAIGISSQCMLYDQFIAQKDKKSSRKQVLFLLSGPEPQRSILENIIREQAVGLKEYDLILVQGKMQVKNHLNNKAFSKIIDLAKGKELFQLLHTSDLIVCRSGYSTLMDLIYLKKKMLLIPTPGQTEQEYLAQYFHQKKWAWNIEQNALELARDIEKVSALQYDFPEEKMQFKPLEDLIEVLL